MKTNKEDCFWWWGVRCTDCKEVRRNRSPKPLFSLSRSCHPNYLWAIKKSTFERLIKVTPKLKTSENMWRTYELICVFYWFEVEIQRVRFVDTLTHYVAVMEFFFVICVSLSWWILALDLINLECLSEELFGDNRPVTPAWLLSAWWCAHTFPDQW